MGLLGPLIPSPIPTILQSFKLAGQGDALHQRCLDRIS